MAKRTNQTFAKRQREVERKEKQRMKSAKRLQRRQQGATPETGAGAAGDAPEVSGELNSPA